MRTRLWRVITPLGFAVVIAVVWFSSLVGQQQAPAPRPAASAPANSFPAYRAPRLNGHPDLNGVWQAFVTANIDLEDHEAQAGPYTELIGDYSGWPAGQSIVEGGVIPYQARGAGEEETERREPHQGRRQQRQDVARPRRSRDEVLHARRPARDLHAVPVSDRAGHRARTS